LSYNLTAQTGSVGIKNFLGTGFWLAWAYFAPAPALPAGTTIGGVAPSSELGPTSGTAAGELPCFTNTSGAFNVCNAAAAYAANITAATGFTLHVKSTQNTAAGTAVLEADKGNVGASAVLRLADTGLTQFDVGLITSDAFNIHDLINGHYIFSLPVNTMPTNSIGGNSNGATAITQPAADNSTNIATDAFVKSNLPLAGTTGSIGGSARRLRQRNGQRDGSNHRHGRGCHPGCISGRWDGVASLRVISRRHHREGLRRRGGNTHGQRVQRAGYPLRTILSRFLKLT
jgi:hypothetical protein